MDKRKENRLDIGEIFMKRKIALIAACMWLVAANFSFAGPALDTVKGNVDEVLKVLKNPVYKGETGKKAKQDQIRKISQKMFDFAELSKRTLGLNWNKFSTPQRQEFVDLYRGLIEDAYTDKITSYTDERINYIKELQLSENTAEVQSIVVTKSVEIPVYCRMLNKDGQWRIYDVVIEGVSLVNNYRTQFREILANNPPENLLDTLRKKVQKR
jgi:phospholipid transport system substrate-binding protein